MEPLRLRVLCPGAERTNRAAAARFGTRVDKGVTQSQFDWVMKHTPRRVKKVPSHACLTVVYLLGVLYNIIHFISERVCHAARFPFELGILLLCNSLLPAIGTASDATRILKAAAAGLREV